MDLRTVITTRPRSRRTPLGDVVTVRRVLDEHNQIHEHITLEVPLELTEPGKTWPTQELVK
jgi:hypothetical protein